MECDRRLRSHSGYSAVAALTLNDFNAHYKPEIALSKRQTREHAIAGFRRTLVLKLKRMWLHGQLAEAEDLHALDCHREAVTAFLMCGRAIFPANEDSPV
jgi:hypothetical protein